VPVAEARPVVWCWQGKIISRIHDAYLEYRPKQLNPVWRRTQEVLQKFDRVGCDASMVPLWCTSAATWRTARIDP
jgi:hypothetical protein